MIELVTEVVNRLHFIRVAGGIVLKDRLTENTPYEFMNMALGEDKAE